MELEDKRRQEEKKVYKQEKTMSCINGKVR
jgi:hypothetical protein